MNVKTITSINVNAYLAQDIVNTLTNAELLGFIGELCDAKSSGDFEMSLYNVLVERDEDDLIPKING